MDTVDNSTGEIFDVANRPLGHIAAALAKAQGEMNNPKKDRSVKVATKTGGSYTFDYATLGSVTDAIRKPLSDNGLSYAHTLIERGNRYRLVTRLMHASGEYIESEMPLFVADQSNQSFGSALSYMKRYALCALLGVAADEDDDGNTADGNTAEKRDRVTPAAKPKDTQPKAAPEVSPAKLAADKLKAAIDAAPHLTGLNILMTEAGVRADQAYPEDGSKLAIIRAGSQTAYEFLLDRAQKRRGMFMASPTEQAAE
jgi:hypothetical protein